jgi:hypothetical protein
VKDTLRDHRMEIVFPPNSREIAVVETRQAGCDRCGIARIKRGRASP